MTSFITTVKALSPSTRFLMPLLSPVLLQACNKNGKHRYSHDQHRQKQNKPTPVHYDYYHLAA